MRDFDLLFRRSLAGVSPLEGRLSARFDLAGAVTFAGNKSLPVYNWFYYKEGFSRDFVWTALRELNVPKKAVVLDPFCGAGTTLLAARQAGYGSVGFDILPLGVFVSRVKLESYDVYLLEDAVRMLCSAKFGKAESRMVDVGFLDMKRAFSPYARNDLMFFRERIMEFDDELVRNFLLLGLISIVSQASYVMKDGGVLKVVQKRHLPPVRHLLRSKLKRMLRDVRDAGNASGLPWRADLGDARNLDLDESSVDAIVTSPPYLNFVDYTKVYALELAMLVSSGKEIDSLRRKSLRSHIGAEYETDEKDWSGLQRILDMVVKSNPVDEKIPLVVEGYFRDLHLSMREAARVLKKNGKAIFVVGNSALPGLTVDVDVLLAEIGQELGFSVEDIWVANVRWAGVHGIEKVRPVRESAVILRKE